MRKPEQHTRWKKVKDDYGQESGKNPGEYYKVFCPYCNHEAYYNTDYGHYEKFDFCPFCGHKMTTNKEVRA